MNQKEIWKDIPIIMDKLITQVTLDSATRKKDRSVSLRFTTTLEQSSEEFMKMDKLINDTGLIYFKSSGQLTKEEIRELDNVELEVEGKTKSQRLRNVLYVYWEQLKDSPSKTQLFNDFYSDAMEKIIEHYKSKLE